MHQVSYQLMDRVGWIFGLGTLFGLLTSSGYLLLR